MADADEIKDQEEQQTPEVETSEKKSKTTRILPWIIMLIVVLVFTGAGFTVGRLFAGSGEEAADASGTGTQDPIDGLKAKNDSGNNAGKVWYYDLDPVVANLNEPSVTRYVRASFTLEMNPELDEQKGTEFLEEKKPVLINWLTVYLSSLNLDDIRGDKNLRSIQAHVRDAFNEQLFPDSKAQIKQVLIKEFPVQ